MSPRLLRSSLVLPRPAPRALLWIALSGLAFATVPARPASAITKRKAEAKEAMAVFQEKHGRVVKLVKDGAAEKKIQEEVDRLLDYTWLAEAALGGGPGASRKCEPKCAEFKTLLSSLIRENYLKRIRHASKGKLEYVGQEHRPRATKVVTKIEYMRDGKPLTMEVAYVMHQVDGSAVWQVRDIITDGVSLSRTYRYEFNKIVRDDGIDELLTRLRSKLTELAAKD